MQNLHSTRAQLRAKANKTYLMNGNGDLKSSHKLYHRILTCFKPVLDSIPHLSLPFPISLLTQNMYILVLFYFILSCVQLE